MFNFKVIPCLHFQQRRSHWPSSENGGAMKIGENIVDFDDAVAVIQNFLSQVAKKTMSKDIFEYLSMVEGYHYFFIK